jgi:hypothetical protein
VVVQVEEVLMLAEGQQEVVPVVVVVLMQVQH